MKRWLHGMRAGTLAGVVGLATGLATAAGTAHAQAQRQFACDQFDRLGSGHTDAAMVGAPDGSLWYAETSDNRLVRMAPDRTFTAVVPIDATTRALSSVTIAGDWLWYAKDKSGRIGRLPLAGGQGAEFRLPGQHIFPTSVRIAPDGRAWFVDSVTNKVGVIDAAGAVSLYDAPSISGMPLAASGFAMGRDGALWMSSIGQNAVYRFDTSTLKFQRFDIATPRAHPGRMSAAPDGSVWFTMTAINSLGRVTPSGQITEFRLPDKGTARTLSVDRDGVVWAPMTTGHIARVDASGRMTSFRCGSSGGSIVQAGDTIYMLGNNKMHRVRDLSAPVATAGAVQASVPPPAAAAGAPTVQVVAAHEVEARVRDAGRRVVVQLSSTDANCGYCIQGNPPFDALAARRASDALYLRVLYAPWTSVGDSTLASRWQIKGLPTTIVFEGGTERARVAGSATADRLENELLGPLQR